MASPSSAAKVVLLSGGVMGAIIAAQGIRHPGAGSTYKRLWAAGVLTVALGAAADFAPGLIVPFSVAIVVAFAIKNPGSLSFILGGDAAGSVAAATSSERSRSPDVPVSRPGVGGGVSGTSGTRPPGGTGSGSGIGGSVGSHTG